MLANVANNAEAYDVFYWYLRTYCYCYADFGPSRIKYRNQCIADRNG